MKKSHGLGAIIVIVSMAFIWLHMCWATSGERVYLGSDTMNAETIGWRLWVGEQDKGITSLPVNTKAKSNTAITLQKRITGTYTDGMYLCFRSTESRVKLFVNDELQYTYGVGKNYVFSESPGSVWNLVKLNNGIGTYDVKIVLESPYEGYSGKLQSVYIGTRTGITTYLIKKNLPIFLMGFLCIIVAIGGLSGFLIIRGVKMEHGMYFSILIFFIGLQFIVESKLEQFAVAIPYLVLQFDYILVTTFPIMMLLYITATEEYRRSRYLKFLFWISLAGAAVVTSLVFLRKADFVEIAYYPIGMWILILLGCLVNQFSRIRESKKGNGVQLRDLAINLFLITGIHDMVSRFVFCEENYFSWYPVGIVLFVIFLLGGYEKEFQKMYLAKLDDEKYRILAYTDALTGLKNRASFEEKIEELRKNRFQSTGYIIMIDMNGLKEINDTLGHKYGDEAIQRVAEAIDQYFSDYGNCYRIGGDEFCVIIDKTMNKRVHFMLDGLTETVSKMRLTNQFSLSIASGYEQFAPSVNETVDDALVKADKRMYLCKRHMKEMEKLS